MKFKQLSSLLPREITTQIILLVALSAIVFHLCITSVLVIGRNYFEPHREPPESASAGAFVMHIADFMRLANTLPPESRQTMIAWLGATFPNLDLRSESRLTTAASPVLAAPTLAQVPIAELQERLGPRVKVGSVAAGNAPRDQRIVFTTDDGLAVSMAAPRPGPPRGPPPGDDRFRGPPHDEGPHDGPPPPHDAGPFGADHPHGPHGPYGPHDGPPILPQGRGAIEMLFATILFIAVSFTIFLVWAIYGLTRPLRKFAEAVESFSADGTPAPLEETGPAELRSAAQALNRMRERVKTMIAQRTEMLAAISHDLRTPVTRLRLRAEFVEPADIKDAILRDLDHINGMIQTALSFIRDGVEAKRNALLDLGALLQTIRDEFTDMGHRVLFEAPGPTFIKGNADELYRAITNLVSNGVKFGTEVEIRLRKPSDGQVQIDIIDNGPGIPAATKAALFSPFSSSAEAQQPDGLKGFGLGLPICQSIVTAHKGALELLERSPHGAIARVTLSA